MKKSSQWETWKDNSSISDFPLLYLSSKVLLKQVAQLFIEKIFGKTQSILNLSIMADISSYFVSLVLEKNLEIMLSSQFYWKINFLFK